MKEKNTIIIRCTMCNHKSKPLDYDKFESKLISPKHNFICNMCMSKYYTYEYNDTKYYQPLSCRHNNSFLF